MPSYLSKTWLGTTSLLVILYTVGIFGIVSSYQAQFLRITPITLLITTGLLFSHHQAWSRKFVIFCGIAGLMSFLVEVIAVKSGLVFGHYHYGAVLGWQLWEVPLIVGINWLVLVYAVGNMLGPLPGNGTFKSMVGAVLMVLIDGLMEPVAIRLGFWQWDSESIPFQNYVIWYILSWVLLLLFCTMHTGPYNKLGWVVYLVLLTFFGLLDWLMT